MLLKSKIDTSEYCYYVSKNGISTLIVRNELFKNSSCALSVGVGSFDEPKEFLGLAHFLEHMVFMGTEKYPNENGFTEYINLHNGGSNAYTCAEHTVYFFEIESEHLKVAADMFANFFISPLLRESSVSREVKAVNSEYQKTIFSPLWRKFMLMNDLIKTDRVEGRFNCGNDETLVKDGLIEALRDFWKTKYSSDIMTLVICGNGSIDELKGVASLFEEIPNHNQKLNKTPNERSVVNIAPEMFKNEYLSNVVHFKPLDGKNELTIYTVLSPVKDLFKINPIGYIHEMLAKVEKGGLIAKLKDMALASDISPNFYQHNRYTHVMIDIKLTKLGFKQYKDVISIAHDFISKMKAERYEYERLGKLGSVDFAYKPISQPADMATELAGSLLDYPVENVLNYEYLYEEFDEKAIDDSITALSDASKWIILVADTDKDATYTNKEKFYGIEYGVYDSWEPECAEVESKRPYLDESIQKCDTEDQFVNEFEVIKSEPRYLKRSVHSNGEVNFVFDSEFDLPKVYLRVIFTSDAVKENPLIYELYFSTLIDMFQTKYGRKVHNAHAELSSKRDVDGISLKFTGFSDSILEIAKLFFTSIPEWSCLSDDRVERLTVPVNRFEVVRQDAQDHYATVMVNSPYQRVSECYLNKLASLKTTEEFLEQVKHIKKDDITFKREFFCKVIAVGNSEFDKIEDLYNTINETYLKGSTATPASIKVGEPGRANFVTTDKVNNAIGVFYTICEGRENAQYEDCEETKDNGLTSDDSYDVKTAIGQLIYQIGNEKFFDELRTNENLGYVVSNTTMQFLTTRILRFIVQSDRSVEFLEERILKFVGDLKEWIKNMDDEEFEGFKKSLIGSYEMPVVNLEDFNDFIFNQYTSGKIDLDYNRRMINVVKSLTREKLLDSDLWQRCGQGYSMKANE